jgi:hypothetical protein
MKEHFDCNLPGLLEEVLNNPTCAILKVPINITKGILAELAHLAIEIDDDRLHIMMLRLGLYDLSAAERVKKIDELREKVRKDLYKRIGIKSSEISKKEENNAKL